MLTEYTCIHSYFARFNTSVPQFLFQYKRTRSNFSSLSQFSPTFKEVITPSLCLIFETSTFALRQSFISVHLAERAYDVFCTTYKFLRMAKGLILILTYYEVLVFSRSDFIPLVNSFGQNCYLLLSILLCTSLKAKKNEV